MKQKKSLIHLGRIIFLTLMSIIGNFSVIFGESEKVIYQPVTFRKDDAKSRAAPLLSKGSHLKVFIPSLPYIYFSHSVNSGLFRPENSKKGWTFDLATDYHQISNTVYEFSLRKGVRFQDGTPFNADIVLLNMEYFKKAPFLFSKLDKRFSHAEKIDDYTVRFYLKERYGQFLNDLIWVHFYTPEYLEKYGWNGKSTCPNLAEPGPYGIGPYILKKGYAEGDRQTPEVVLEANPNYWNKTYPKIEKITIYTELSTDEAITRVQDTEGELDITPIPFARKVETMLSEYAKVITSPSTNNFAIHMNLRNGNLRLLEKTVRVALNQAINQANLLNFVYEWEGKAIPTVASPLFPGVDKVIRTLRPYSEIRNPEEPEVQAQLKQILNGLRLKVFTQERFMFLWKGIEYQLSKVGVSLAYEITKSEKDIFAQLLTTNAKKNTKDWDLLIWGMDDWYYNHPWTVFLVYRTHDFWSTIFPDPVLDKYIESLFCATPGTPEFDKETTHIMHHVYDNGYMLFVPSPNTVLAVNKEVIFAPYTMASLPLWEIEVTREHWSLRKGAYPDALKQPVSLIHANQEREEHTE